MFELIVQGGQAYEMLGVIEQNKIQSSCRRGKRTRRYVTRNGFDEYERLVNDYFNYISTFLTTYRLS